MHPQSGQQRHQTHVIFGPVTDAAAAIRCDLDAVTHARDRHVHTCGHAVNMAAVLTLASQLAVRQPDTINRTCLIFQPAEEGPGNKADGFTHPRGFGGGQYLRDLGIYSELPRLISAHIDTSLPQDTVRITSGTATAAAYRFSFDARGQPAHAALPWQGTNPLDAITSFLVSCDELNRRFADLAATDPSEYGLVTVSQVNTAPCELNSLAPVAYARGISRVVGTKTLETFKSVLKRLGATWELEAPPVINDSALAELAATEARRAGYRVDSAAARFRDETAWAGEFDLPWADPTNYPSGCPAILHFFVPGGERCGLLHSEDFRSRTHPIHVMVELIGGIVTRLTQAPS